MVCQKLAIAFIALSFIPQISVAQNLSVSTSGNYLLAQNYSCGKTCGAVRSCKEAVYQWCVCGYNRADGDNDGVPCEKICGQSTAANLRKVQSLKAELGCR